MSRRRETLKLKEDEVAIVFPVETWRHVVLVYETLAQDFKTDIERGPWLNVADVIRYNLERAEPTNDKEDF